MTMAVSVTQLHRMAQGDDGAAAEIWRAVGPMNGWHPFGQWVVGAIYHPPMVTRGGLLLPDHSMTRSTEGAQGMSTHLSHRLEGKAFMLLTHGPEAFPERLLARWGGKQPSIGSWFFAMARDGVEISLDFGGEKSDRVEGRGWPCRIFQADDIMGPIPHPGCLV